MSRPGQTHGQPQLRVGCSGWNYESWRGIFYPARLPTSDWLAHYARQFDTVEVNNTFYRLPELGTFAAWREQTPSGFLMAVKASRFLTHMKRLRDPAEPVARLLSRIRALGSRLGPVLYQLPANFHVDLDRLDDFLSRLPHQLEVDDGSSAVSRPLRHVVEFRHPSWYNAETYAVLERRGAALCLHDRSGAEIREPFVGPLVYVRFHGASGNYQGSYEPGTLAAWADRLHEAWSRGRDVYAYFNNDPGAVATQNARVLRDLFRSKTGECAAG